MKLAIPDRKINGHVFLDGDLQIKIRIFSQISDAERAAPEGLLNQVFMDIVMLRKSQHIGRYATWLVHPLSYLPHI